MDYRAVIDQLPDLSEQDREKKPAYLRAIEALPDLSQPATTMDRAQAAASGVNKGALAYLPGFAVDTALNVADLARAGYGTVGRATGFLKPEDMPQLLDRAGYVGSSEWLANQVRKTPIVIDPKRPDDAVSRAMHTGGSALAQALLMGGPRAPGGGLGLPPGPFSSSPVMLARDGGMAFTSGALGQAVGDATDSPSMGLLASFAPQLATQGSAMAIRGAARGGERGRENMAARLEDLRNAGVDAPSLGLATGGRGATWIDSILSKLPGSAGVYARTGEGVQGGMQRRVDQIRDTTSPNSTPLASGQRYQEAIIGPGGYRDKFQDVYQRLDNRATRYIQEGEQNMRALGYDGFPIPNTLRAAADITNPIPGAENISALLQTPRMPGIAQALNRDAAPRPPQSVPSAVLGPDGQPLMTQAPGSLGGVPYEAIAGLSTKLGKEAASRAIIGTPEAGDFKRIYGALARDKELAAAASLNPRAVPALQEANRFYSQGRTRIDELQPYVGSRGEPVAPETTYARLAATAQSKPSELARLLSSVRGDVRASVASTVIDGLGRATPGAQNAEGTRFSSDTFLTRYNQIPAASKSLLFTPAVRRDLDTVARAADRLKSSARVMANPSGSATTGANIAALGSAGGSVMGGVFSGQPTAGLAGAATVLGMVGVANLGARTLTNPLFVNWLSRATTMDPPRIRQSAARLAANATAIRDEETRAEVEDFLARVLDETSAGVPGR